MPPRTETVASTPVTFDYESKRWGAARLEPRPWFMNGLKLRYLLADLGQVTGRVLDVGCGAGSVAKAVKRHRPDLEVHGCDLSQAALAVAAAPSAEGVDFRLATAERLRSQPCTSRSGRARLTALATWPAPQPTSSTRPCTGARSSSRYRSLSPFMNRGRAASRAAPHCFDS